MADRKQVHEFAVKWCSFVTKTSTCEILLVWKSPKWAAKRDRNREGENQNGFGTDSILYD